MSASSFAHDLITPTNVDDPQNAVEWSDEMEQQPNSNNQYAWPHPIRDDRYGDNNHYPTDEQGKLEAARALAEASYVADESVLMEQAEWASIQAQMADEELSSEDENFSSNEQPKSDNHFMAVIRKMNTQAEVEPTYQQLEDLLSRAGLRINELEAANADLTAQLAAVTRERDDARVNADTSTWRMFMGVERKQVWHIANETGNASICDWKETVYGLPTNFGGRATSPLCADCVEKMLHRK